MKQTTTIRIDRETKEALDQIKIDLAASRRQAVTTDGAIRELIRLWYQEREAEEN